MPVDFIGKTILLETLKASIKELMKEPKKRENPIREKRLTKVVVY